MMKMSSASLSHVPLKVSYEQFRVGISGKSDLSMNPGKFTATMLVYFQKIPTYKYNLVAHIYDLIT